MDPEPERRPEAKVRIITGRTLAIIERFLVDQGLPREYFLLKPFGYYLMGYKAQSIVILEPKDEYSTLELEWFNKVLSARIIPKITQVIRLKDSAFN